MHVVAVLRIIKQKGLPKKCRVLAMAVVRQSKVLKNLKEAAESRGTVLTFVDVQACKVVIEQTIKMLQEAQRAQDKAIAEMYQQLRNLLSGDTQSQWDCICREMHERDSWAAVNGQVTKGRCLQMWMSFLDCLKCWHSQKAAVLHSASGAQAPKGHCATAYLTNGSVE